jgi:hypothetical protein
LATGEARLVARRVRIAARRPVGVMTLLSVAPKNVM